MGIEEGLGDEIRSLDFVVTEVKGNLVKTDCYPKQFDITRYAPFDYKEGQRYFRNIWLNGEFVTSEETGETYLVPFPGGSGQAIKVEGSLDEFVRRIQAEGRKNEFNRLMGEGKIAAMVRTHAYMGDSALLEVALVETNKREVDNPFEAYSILANLQDGTARIIKATCEHGVWDEDIAQFRVAKPLALPSAIIKTAEPHNAFTAGTFRPLEPDSMRHIRDNCYRPASTS